MAAVHNIIELRRMMSERYPDAHAVRRPAGGVVPTGVPALDVVLGGGLPRGGVTELVGEGFGSGTAQVIHALLARSAREGAFMALIDGMDSFDVDAADPDALHRLLWARCRSAEEALKAADLLLRDRNVPVVVLDLKMNAAGQLRRIPSSVWHRLGRIAEHNGTTLLVVTPAALVGAVAVRVEACAGLGLEVLKGTASEALEGLRFTLARVAGAMEAITRTGAA